ncbi:ferredoxin [Azospirillum sp. TSA2s]|uniref:(2Fe-2S) ferredoxin domain-containing protein n=1 Tax=Azospirillum sp. TSA2s TaxID=709810 RepID=UPI001FFEC5C5|nr:(2Fe-2S) ferredoxin domain-containing protein [Azospirillum sp. TSA2s]
MTDHPIESQKPYFEAHVFCCTNRRPDGHRRGSCAAHGSEKLRDYMKARARELGFDGKVRINSAGCLDRCELGPTLVIYPEGVWYTYHSTGDVDEILQTHLVEGRHVERLMLTPEQRELRPEQRG